MGGFQVPLVHTMKGLFLWPWLELELVLVWRVRAGVRIQAICHRVTTAAAAAAALIADHKAISAGQAGPGQVLGANVLPHLLAAAQTHLLASLRTRTGSTRWC